MSEQKQSEAERIREKFKDYNPKALEYILGQGEKKLDETLISFRQLSNANYIAFAFYSTLATYWISKLQLEQNWCMFWLYCAMLISAGACIFFSYKNLLPRNLILRGANPERLIDKYYTYQEPDDESQIRLYHTWQIDCLEGYIKMNETVNAKRIKAFKTGIRIACISGFVYALIIVIYRASLL